ncbi:hypothetical protein PsYK624_059800 [Phanerochaete sordida]|uniref:Uncharacterized protein n=1 Tax=Phanerochaete sordida TaxID=48140 RepID=A0A9P3G9J1_9APHY|nr:hypothetical protein PsYK624_059800 [Phanerochaete sordida]
MTAPEAVTPASSTVLPETYIKLVYHPHSGIEQPAVIPLDSAQASSPIDETAQLLRRWAQLEKCMKPWAPFRTRADFEYAESVVKGTLGDGIVDLQLRGMRNGWCEHSNITFQNHDGLRESLAAAHIFTVKFQTGSVSAVHDGTEYTFKFPYRDPWAWILELVTDKSLLDSIMWWPVKKYLVTGWKETRLYDETNTGDAWYNAQDTLPPSGQYPHVFLPLHFWLDKGNVTRKVKKHPMVLRPAFLPHEIRNASGNGGGILLGFMPVIDDPANPEDRTASEKLEFARFKREVYHKVLSVVFSTLKRSSNSGEAVKCADELIRILWTGFLIHSADLQEAEALCAIRAALANHPCPQCLVEKCDLHRISLSSTPRTSSFMQDVYHRAKAATTKTEKERILRDHGLHDTENFFWSMKNSDPYMATSYDVLHADDLGKFGHHLWPLTLEILKDAGYLGRLAKNMRNVPRWANLKHFNNATTIEYADGQTFYDILRCLLPCLVELMPRNSALIHCLRAYAKFRVLIGLKCVSEDSIKLIEAALADYEKYATKVGEEYGKNFDFLKQHQSHHIVPDIRNKGATVNTVTRPGEGFHQEVEQAYEQTNRKDAEFQMARIDENQEAIARIRMTVDSYDKAREQLCTIPEHDEDEEPDQEGLAGADLETMTWALGSKGPKVVATAIESRNSTDPIYRDFSRQLVSFLTEHIQDEPALQLAQYIKIIPFKCVYLRYQSMEDWREARDILRCNPDFHGHPRYDCALINLASNALAWFDPWKSRAWKPRTVWNGCRVFEEKKTSEFVFVEYLTRGAHLIPTFEMGRGESRRFYFNDTIDADMLLHRV